jgi:hypothetical protein
MQAVSLQRWRSPPASYSTQLPVVTSIDVAGNETSWRGTRRRRDAESVAVGVSDTDRQLKSHLDAFCRRLFVALHTVGENISPLFSPSLECDKSNLSSPHQRPATAVLCQRNVSDILVCLHHSWLWTGLTLLRWCNQS